jgi:broad specificity phosphatase PhoE
MYDFQNIFRNRESVVERNVYFVSHGEAKDTFNKNDQSTLSEEGFEQAELLEKRFAKIRPEIILLSSVPCARETASIINKALRVPREESGSLIQRRMPTEYIKQRDPVEAQRIKQKMREYHRKGEKYSDEETFDELKERAENALRKVIGFRSEKHILVISHVQTIRAILGVMLLGDKFNLEIFITMDKILTHVNTAITWCRQEGSSWRLVTWNDHAHLG